MSNPRSVASVVSVLGLVLLLGLSGCGDSTVVVPQRNSSPLLFSPQNNDLNVYAPRDGGRKQVVVSGNENGHDPNKLALNGQVCFNPNGSRQFIMGQDAGQPNPPAGWAILQLAGTELGSFSVTRLAQLTPTYQEAPDNFGCGAVSTFRTASVFSRNSPLPDPYDAPASRLDGVRAPVLRTPRQL